MEPDEPLKDENAHLRLALVNRDVIGQAKGILIERHGITADEAFDRLVRISQTTNTKVSMVAESMVADALEESPDRAGSSG